MMFGSSSSMRNLAFQALNSWAPVVATLQQECASASDPSWYQRMVNSLTGSTANESICNRASTAQAFYDTCYAKASDSSTSDEALAEIIGYVHKNLDISDVVELAEAEPSLSNLGKALLRAPGTAIGLTGDAASIAIASVGEGLGSAAKSLLKAIPWWVWAAGGVFVAVQLGWRPLNRTKKE